MTSSTMPQQPGAHSPDTTEVGRSRQRKERSQPTLWAVASVFFVLGAAISTGTIWQLHKLYIATIANPVSVEGILKAKYDYESDNSPTPDPGGYYIESSSIGRVYLTGQPLQSSVGEIVSASGSVSSICGPKSIPCYPLLEVREIGPAPAAE